MGDLEAAGEEVLLAGDGVRAHAEVFGRLERAELAGAEFVAPSASALVELATRRVELEDFEPPWELAPMYLRASDAEIDWERVRAGAP